MVVRRIFIRKCWQKDKGNIVFLIQKLSTKEVRNKQILKVLKSNKGTIYEIEIYPDVFNSKRWNWMIGNKAFHFAGGYCNSREKCLRKVNKWLVNKL